MPEAGARPRYAIYFAADPTSPLWRFGSAVIGYDAASGRDVEPLVPAGVSPEAWRRLTEDPRRYGFHATLKAPFHLRSGSHREGLAAALAAFAKGQAPVALGRLAVVVMSRFLALTAPDAGPPLGAFAQEVVEAFEPFRAQLTDAERARRLAAPLSPRQGELLERFGYPYVAEEFRFHMTLAGPVPAADLASLRDGLARVHMLRVPDEPLLLDRLCLFEQPTPAERFRIAASARLG